MRDLLLVGTSFVVALLGAWAWFDLPVSLIGLAFPFVVLVPAAVALLVGWLAPRIEGPQPPPGSPDQAR
jgi:hypothetical protein